MINLLQFELLIPRGRLTHILHRLLQRRTRLLVVPVLVDLDVGTGLEERRKILKCLRLLVKSYDVLH